MQQDFANLLESLKENPEQGADLGKGLHKVRMVMISPNVKILLTRN